MYPMTLNNIHVVGCTCGVSGYVKELQLSVTQDKKISIFILGVTWCCDALQEIDNQRAGEMLAKLYASANVLFAVQRLQLGKRRRKQCTKTQKCPGPATNQHLEGGK